MQGAIDSSGRRGSAPWTRLAWLVASCAVVLGLAACSPIQPPAPGQDDAALVQEADASSPVVEYDLGEAVVIQERFPAGDRFREMPVRLNGVIAAPAAGGPYPVVLILHGTHPGCPVDDMGIDRWPCDPEVEQPNYRGFGYLVSELAARGYVALSININADNTFGFGEPTSGERLRQLVDLHLGALAEASAGGDNAFGLDLTGRADLHRLAVFGHSRGGEAAVALARDLAAEAERGDLVYGPIDGLLLIAAGLVFVDPAGGAPAPMAIVLPACDGDVTSQDGQFFFETTRLAPAPSAWVTSAWLERANHNAFNSLLPGDPFGTPDRPDCESLLTGEEQRDFLVNYAADFLTTIFNHDPAQVRAAMQRMGMEVAAPAPAELYTLDAQAAVLLAARHRLPLLTPASETEFTTSPAGGAVTAEALELHFCPAGFYTPQMLPGSEPCRRATVTVPGQPAHAVLAWEDTGAALRFALPEGLNNLLLFDAVSVRVAVDPLSPLNPAGVAQAFSVQLIDRAGNTATVQTRPAEPALRFPPGLAQAETSFGQFFTGRAPLLPVRAPLGEFAGVDRANIVEVALLFDQTNRGTLFLADVELVRAPISSQETLGEPPSAELIAAAEAGDVEAMRQLANLYRPTDALGVQYGNLAQAVYWYRQACAAGYANAQVDFYEFARLQADVDNDVYLEEAVACLEDAIRQGHRGAIRNGAFRAAFIEQEYQTAFFLYALLEEADPELAAQRFAFADQLTQAEIDEAEQAAAEWRAVNQIKDYNDFFAEVDSPFRKVAP
jgi:hypothetical protein